MYRSDGVPLFAAGLWSVWRGREGGKDEAPLLSCTIITTDAVGELAQIHDRMPLMLAEDDWDGWLNPDAPLDTELLARPPDVRDIELREVSKLVNSVRNNGPELLEPAKAEPEQITLL
jgi:putative SOS response-associated peptidase YedK